MEANQMKRKWKWFLIVMLVAVLPNILAIGWYEWMRLQGLVWIPSCTGPSWSGHWGPPEYYRGPGIAEPWDSAPDGWYWVQSGWESSNGTVTFPLCPSSGTRLHGTWNCTVDIPENYAGYVYVENNTITIRGQD